MKDKNARKIIEEMCSHLGFDPEWYLPFLWTTKNFDNLPIRKKELQYIQNDLDSLRDVIMALLDHLGLEYNKVKCYISKKK